MKIKPWLGSVLSVALVAAGVTIAIEARAATKSGCTINTVQFDNGRIALWCANDANIYYAFTGNGCAANNVASDTLKVWVNILTSSHLAGRSVDFDYNAPSGGACVDRAIVSLRQQ